jgi:hypothetical protein
MKLPDCCKTRTDSGDEAKDVFRKAVVTIHRYSGLSESVIEPIITEYENICRATNP